MYNLKQTLSALAQRLLLELPMHAICVWLCVCHHFINFIESIFSCMNTCGTLATQIVRKCVKQVCQYVHANFSCSVATVMEYLGKRVCVCVCLHEYVQVKKKLFLLCVHDKSAGWQILILDLSTNRTVVRTQLQTFFSPQTGNSQSSDHFLSHITNQVPLYLHASWIPALVHSPLGLL